jgi:iron complex transport system ATP-binding protein
VAIEKAMRETRTDAFAERPVTQLSGGERQRLHLARALAQETRIIVLDEPTANLDLTHQFAALTLIKEFTRRGGAALAAIHDLTLAARFCDRLLLLSESRIVAEGTPEEVIGESNLARHFGLRARVRCDNQGLTVYPLAAG